MFQISHLVQPICRCGACVTAPNNHNIRLLGKLWGGLKISQGRLSGLDPVGLCRISDGKDHGVVAKEFCSAITMNCPERVRMWVLVI